MKKIKKKRHRIRTLFFIVILLLTYIYTLKLLDKVNLDISNSFINNIINSSSSLSSENIITYKSFKEMIKFQPNQLLNNNLVYYSNNSNVEIVDTNKDNNSNIDTSPIVYIYNTHQTESYNSEYLTDYSITPTVMISSYMLKEDLESYGIYSYVEEDSFSDVLKENNWKYYKSYQVSRLFIEKRKEELNTLKYYIDLHRDSVSEKYTTTTIDGISYARIMILVGLDHDNYQDNLNEAEKINSLIEEKYPGLSRGIYKKSGSGVNGIYNQDYSKYVFLFEIGGVDNNISEVNNTIVALAKILALYIEESD